MLRHFWLQPSFTLSDNDMPEPSDISGKFQPDYTPEQLENLGVYDALYRGQGPRLASLGEWKPEWISEHDPKGWAQWYKRYASGRRIADEDERQIKRWLSFKARHGGPFAKNPTPRRGWALRNWGIDPAKLVAAEQANSVTEMLDEYQRKAMQKYVQDKVKQAQAQLGDVFPVSCHERSAEAEPGQVERVAPAFLKQGSLKLPAYVRIKIPNEDQHLFHKYIRANKWDHPAGKIEDGETPNAAAIRELMERTGYSGNVEDLEDLGVQGDFYEYSIPYAKLTQVAKPGERGGYSTDVKFQKQSNDLTKLAPKWSDRAHLLAALPKHLTDTQTAIQNAGDIDKEMTDLALISRAWLKSQRQKELLAARLKKFQETAQYPSLAAVKQSAVYNFEGDVQGVSLRKTLHKVLDELKHPGLAYNNARTGEARAIIPGNKKKQQEVLDLLEFYLASRQHNAARPNSSRALQRGVDYKITPLPKQKEPLHKVVLKPDDIQKFIQTQGFNRLAAENADYQKQWLTERYRLQLDAAGNLSGRVPELAKKQLFSGEPVYEYQLAPGWQDVKAAELNPDVQLQEHQQRVQDRVTTDNPRMLIYHGLGSGKSLSAIAAAETARKLYGDNYGVVVPASLRDNFRKEIKKFTTGASKPEVMSYTGLALGKKFQIPPETLIMDEAARLRNPNAASTRAAARAAQQAKRVLLLTGTPITNTPGDLAPLVSMLHGETIEPKDFEQRYVQHEKVWPGLWNFLRGIKPGVRAKVRRRDELIKLLEGRVDYHPSKKPEGVNVQEEIIETSLTPEQQKIEKAIRTTIPPGFLWKLDREFPLSKDELARLNGFLTGLRQVGLSTQTFRADKDPLKAFEQSGKLTTAMQNLRKVLDEDPRKKALIYTNFINAGIEPYAAALARDGIPAGVFHGGISPEKRQRALNDYNTGKLRALLLGPAAAEGISTKGTSLIQLLDPHWNEARSQQAQGRGLRFDSHHDLPEELKNVAVQRYLNKSEEPKVMSKIFGGKRHRTADEILARLTAEKEQLNEEFRNLLREIGTRPRNKSE